ncbi:hypothetical protein BOTCAL_0259g00100 [Botryotinia calthae]|uniref:Uncharacterized protein n=1 Tax=Botryotinia calthae TaxID=38488 RepID=A0A4Y8CYI3_9HELO|nr:hypothetical protein BOTCAL_0259g00100 [Botryotinia calthae]
MKCVWVKAKSESKKYTKLKNSKAQNGNSETLDEQSEAEAERSVKRFVKIEIEAASGLNSITPFSIPAGAYAG